MKVLAYLILALLLVLALGCKTGTDADAVPPSPQGKLDAGLTLTTRASETIAAVLVEDHEISGIIGRAASEVSKSADPLAKAQTPNLWQAKGRLDQNGVRLGGALENVKSATTTFTEAKRIDLEQEKLNEKRIAKIHADEAALQKKLASAKENRWAHMLFVGLSVLGFVGAVYFGYVSLTSIPSNPKAAGLSIACAALAVGAIAIDRFYDAIGLIGFIAGCVAFVGLGVALFLHVRKMIHSAPPGTVAVIASAPPAPATATVSDTLEGSHVEMEIPAPAVVVTPTDGPTP